MISLASILLLVAASSAPGDDWVSLGALPGGSARGARIAALLEAGTGPLELPAQKLAFAAAARAVEDYDLELALAIQVPLERRVGAPWSAFDLALTLQKAGRVDEADGVFERMLSAAAAEQRPGLWAQRGILALGAGRGVSARAYFGHALARGDADAAAVLARESLGRHNLTPARNGFRAALARNRTHPWALRGWGLSVLPDPGP